MEICIIDDDRVYQLLMKRLIHRVDESIVIKTFYNGEDAFNYYKNHPCKCQIMLLDINMPKMDGWEFLENIHIEDFKDSCIYLATSSTDYSDQEKAKKFDKVKGYLTKPITKEKIKEITEAY
ncbi:MAG TPA: response regulator [Flavobacteriaceae bacterium]|nr:response regulator [Flavobacteriaceae bacterium]